MPGAAGDTTGCVRGRRGRCRQLARVRTRPEPGRSRCQRHTTSADHTGAPDTRPVQTLPRLTLGRQRDDYGGKAELPFSTLNAIQASEMLRDVGELADAEA